MALNPYPEIPPVYFGELEGGPDDSLRMLWALQAAHPPVGRNDCLPELRKARTSLLPAFLGLHPPRSYPPTAGLQEMSNVGISQSAS